MKTYSKGYGDGFRDADKLHCLALLKEDPRIIASALGRFLEYRDDKENVLSQLAKLGEKDIAIQNSRSKPRSNYSMLG